VLQVLNIIHTTGLYISGGFSWCTPYAYATGCDLLCDASSPIDIVPWSVCLFVTFVHCAQTAKEIDTISLHTIAPFLSQIALKFWLRFCPNVTHPCWFERRIHSMANCGRMVRDSAMDTMRKAYRKPPSVFQMLPYDPPFPQNVVPKCTPRTNFAMRAATCRIWQWQWQWCLFHIRD